MVATANPVHASVAFIRIAEFAALSVAEQAARKEKLEARAQAALRALPVAERIVLDVEDGVALVMFTDVERALDIGQAIHGKSRDLPLQVGINYGPLALTSTGSDARVFGDGLSAAAAASRFAAPDKILVTDGFARALEAGSPDRATELANAGEFTDTRVRLHTFFTPDPGRGVIRRRRLALYAAGGAIGILLLGVLGRDVYQPLFQSRPAIVKLDIKPRGEVFVDGVSRGKVPPLSEIEIPPGARKVLIRNPGYRPHEVDLVLKPGQRLTISHTLARLPEPRKGESKKGEVSDFWRDLKKSFGGK